MAERASFRLLVVGYGQTEITFLQRLLRGLVDQGVQVTLATASKRVIKSFPKGSLRWLWAPSWNGGGLLRAARLLALCFQNLLSPRKAWLRAQLRQAKTPRQRFETLYRYLPFGRGEWDLIYFPWNSAAIDYSGLYELGIPVVVSCRGSQVNIRPHLPGQEGFKEKLIISLRKAAVVHCVSEQIRQEVLSFAIEQGKTAVIHPALDPNFFRPGIPAGNEGKLRLITTGALIWRKGYEYLLQAVQQLQQAQLDFELNIIGEGVERQRLLYTIADLGLAGRVNLLGQLEPAVVLQRLQQSDVFVLSSLSEGISNAVLEAMSCGLPVVTTACGGMREAVSDGVEGFVVPIRDPETMAAALKKLAADPILRQRMGQAGRERILKDFQLSGQVEAFIRLCNQAQAAGLIAEQDG